MSVHEFFEFFREYLHSEYDLMNGLTIDDFMWLKTRMNAGNLHFRKRRAVMNSNFLEYIP